MDVCRLSLGWILFALCAPAPLLAATSTLTLNVVDDTGAPIANYRWLVEEDNTWPVKPGVLMGNDTLSLSFHRSYMPVVAKGTATANPAVITLPDATKRYYISVLPFGGHAMSGGQVDAAAGQTALTVTLNSLPVPTAQIAIFVFEDNYPINNTPELPQEQGIGGFTIKVADMGGEISKDAYGNPLGTQYTTAADGSPVVTQTGTGVITTMTAADVNDPVKNPYGLKVGEALVKYLPPGKYGVTVSPIAGQGWQQTNTIEGSPVIDAWVKSNEPPFLLEFGPTIHHTFYGFIRPFNAVPAPGPAQATGNVSGRVVNGHVPRPPAVTSYLGHPIPNCWIGLNNSTSGQGVYAGPCNEDSTFTIENVPSGTWQLVMWDKYLNIIVGFATVIVPEAGGPVALGDVPVFGWFGEQHHYVFYDADGDGRRDADEAGIPDQLINLRFRDGTIYQSSATDTVGFVPFETIFPFFDWQVAEVDFTRYKATGVTVTVDNGGPVDTSTTDAPGYGRLNPQVQADGALQRTETGPVLLEGYQSFQGTTHVFEWGKSVYGPGENGGISGVVQYATTRAENDPMITAAEPWEPGIPRVQVNLYQDNGDGVTIKDVNGSGAVELADVDNHPFGWADGSASKGPEDFKRNNLGAPDSFNAGDAIQFVTADSWDDNLPTGCVGDPADPFYQNGKCHDGLRNFTQVRPALFDGGYAFASYFPGGASSGSAEVTGLPASPYIVEAVTPTGYEHQKEEDKNVDFGDDYTPSPLLLPPPCVGDYHAVPAELTLFPGVASAYAGQSRRLCDRKQVVLTTGKNAAANFFMFTEVPVTGHIKGLVTSDVNNEFDPNSPNAGEKFSPAWTPIAFRDWTGREVTRVYTDEHGAYNALVPSTYSMNIPMPSGVSPAMYQVCINDPGPIADPANPGATMIDPSFNKKFMSLCLTFNFQPGMTTYLDTPVLPSSAFAGSGNAQLDCDYANRTPLISSVTAAGNLVGGGPYINTATGASRQLTIRSVGSVQVPDPFATGAGAATNLTITRDHGFGTGKPRVRLNNLDLTVTAWNNDVILATVQSGRTSGQLEVRRDDNRITTPYGVHVTVGGGNVMAVAPGGSIQTAVDAASNDALILVPPGTYKEQVILHKPVRLQGWGAGVTILNASRSIDSTGFLAWREKVNGLVNGPIPSSGLLPGQPNNEISPQTGQHVPGTGLLATEEGAGVLVWPQAGEFTSTSGARIDGLTITGADASAGILVNGYASYLTISNNRVEDNTGVYGAGIRVGHPFLADASGNPVSGGNDHLNIHHNHVSYNGAISAPGGGIALYNGSDDYVVSRNLVCGNFSRGDGAGIAHYGRSLRGRIANNIVTYNQGFEQTPARGGDGGGILVSGLAQPVTAAIPQGQGTGSVTITANMLHGNHAGSGDGGGISLRRVNGQDVLASPNNSGNWYTVDVLNNLIVNNVAGLAGGGISLQDVARANIRNNTIAHNDSTATAGAAFDVLNPGVSLSQPAGIVSRRHSDALIAAIGTGGGSAFADFSNATLRNNIVFNNRTMHWSTDPVTGLGVVSYDGVRDLGVLGMTAQLDPRNSLLTSNNTGYHSSNVLVDSTTPIFVQPYFNAVPGTNYLPDGTLLPLDITSVPQSAAAFDEGGNFIEVAYGPLSVHTTPRVDYHSLPGSPAQGKGAGNNIVLFSEEPADLVTDYDGEPRPTYAATTDSTNLTVDIGADEILPSDPDEDGLHNALDNCTVTANADQRDTNGDGYGNVCDGDLNGDQKTNVVDYNKVKAAVGKTAGQLGFTLDADFNGDGKVSIVDLNYFKAKLLGKAPGPACCAP